MVRRPGGRHRHGARAARPGQPGRPLVDDLAGERHGHDLGATTSRPARCIRARPAGGIPSGSTATAAARSPAAAAARRPTGTVESEGIYSGYRYFDKLGITPQVPFGYGLSYTSFSFSNLNVTPKLDGTVDVGFDVKNTGSRAGDEVAQVYVGPGPDHAGIQQAVRSLRGFDRVSLDAGQTKHEVINLDRRSFQYWDDTTQQWLTQLRRAHDLRGRRRRARPTCR